MNYKLLAQGYNPIPPGVFVPPGEAVTLSRADELLRIIGNYLITFSIIFAVIFIVWGGISFMMAQGGSTDDARKKVTNAIIGAAIVLGVGLILKTVAAVITQRFFCLGFFC